MINLKVGQIVCILDEVAQLSPDVYKVEKIVDKFVVVTGKFRIHRSRVQSIVNERSTKLGKDKSTNLDGIGKAEEAKAKSKPPKQKVKPKPEKATKAKPSKFDLASLKQGTLLHKTATPFPPQNPTMKRESFVWISADGSQEKVFNLYDGTLGKKGKEPKIRSVDKDRFPDLEARVAKWTKQGYKPVK